MLMLLNVVDVVLLNVVDVVLKMLLFDVVVDVV